MIESSINTFPIPTHLKCHQAYHHPTLCHSPSRGLQRGNLSEEKKQQQSERMMGVGKGRICSDEAKAKIAESNTGKVRTPEMLQRLSKAHIGLQSGMKGKKLPEERKQRISNKITELWQQGLIKGNSKG